MSSTLDRLRKQAKDESKTETAKDKKDAEVKAKAEKATQAKKVKAEKAKAKEDAAIQHAKDKKASNKKSTSQKKETVVKKAVPKKVTTSKNVIKTKYLDSPKKEVLASIKGTSYHVSNHGKVYSEKKNGDKKEMVSLVLGNYPVIDIRQDGQRLRLKVNELVEIYHSKKAAKALLDLNQA